MNDLDLCTACGGTLNPTAEARREAIEKAEDCPKCWRWAWAAYRKAKLDMDVAQDADQIRESHDHFREFFRKLGRVMKERAQQSSW